MFVRFWLCARYIWANSNLSRKLCVAVGSASLAIALEGCAGAHTPTAQDDPANPQARTPSATYRSVTSGYVGQRPSAPLSWRERNERVAPQPKQ
jgi:hypothetical protein